MLFTLGIGARLLIPIARPGASAGEFGLDLLPGEDSGNQRQEPLLEGLPPAGSLRRQAGASDLRVMPQ